MALTPQQAFVRALALSRKYTDDTVVGGGAIKGKNCIIKTISLIPGGHQITFEWTLDNGTVQTDTLNVMDGAAGDLEDISDVDINNLADGQILQYNATSDKWENVSPGSVDTNLGDLNDVDFDNLTDGQIIVWDATNQKWVNSENSPTITVDSDISSASENPVQNKVIKSALDEKVDKVTGKGLSTNDYTNEDKSIVDGITAALGDKISKSSTAGLVKNDGTIDTNSYAEKVTSATSGNFAGLDSNGNLTDSGKKASDFSTSSDIQDVYEIMGKNGAKNLIPYPYGQTSRTDNGVTYTVNTDGSVLVDGTATANSTLTLQYRQTPSKINLKVGESYIATGGVSAQLSVGVSTEREGSAYYYGYDKGSGLEFTPESGDEKFGALIQVTNGSTVNNVTVYPMIRPASDTDSTYRQYAMTNKELTDSIGKITETQWIAINNIL